MCRFGPGQHPCTSRAQSRPQHYTSWISSASVGREILSYALLNSDWTSGFFLLILRAYHGLPLPAACAPHCACTTCMHSHTLQSSVIGHLRPGHNTIVYKKCLVHIYTAVTWATLLSLSWRECIHFTRKLSSFFGVLYTQCCHQVQFFVRSAWLAL